MRAARAAPALAAAPRRAAARQRHCAGTPAAVAGLRAVGDRELAQLGAVRLQRQQHGGGPPPAAAGGSPPLILHCGAAWSQRSRSVADRLAEWARDRGAAGVECATTELAAAPQLVEQRHIRSVPTVMLIRGGKVERRVDGADVADLDRLLRDAGELLEAEAGGEASPAALLAAAEDLERRGEGPERVAPLYERLLGDGADPAFGFRARLGLLRMLLQRAEKEGPQPSPELAEELATAVSQLHERHAGELQPQEAVRQDAASVARLVAHAELLADAWTGQFTGEEGEVLSLYAAGREEEALAAALAWYQQAASGNMPGLISALTSPLRHVPDRRGEPPPSPLFSQAPFAQELDQAPGPAAPRSMIRRVFAALGPTDPRVAEARAELEFLLDTKKHVPFYTRIVYCRRGGRPVWGWGTGKRSGFSRRYWLVWGPGTKYRNSRRMGSPHCDKND